MQLNSIFNCQCLKLISSRYPLDKWNIYIRHFSDSNHKSGDENESLFFLKYKILPIVNSFCYGKLKKKDGVESLFNIAFKEMDNIKVFNLRKRGHVYSAMEKCFESGH